MRRIFTLLLSLCVTITIQAQKTAMDFEQPDCAGVQHHLYSELDAGQVVILDFVMLNCVPCIVGTTALEELVAPYGTTHPGRVALYSFGFLDTYTCDQLNAWIGDNGFSHPVFSGGAAQTAYYGGMGMPTIVVVGSSEHQVYYNGKGYTPSMGEAILAAIDSALLYNPMGVKDFSHGSALTVFPSPFRDRLSFRAKDAPCGSMVRIFDLAGSTVMSAGLNGDTPLTLETGGLAPGIYFAGLEYQGSLLHVSKIIKQ